MDIPDYMPVVHICDTYFDSTSHGCLFRNDPAATRGIARSQPVAWPRWHVVCTAWDCQICKHDRLTSRLSGPKALLIKRYSMSSLLA